MSQTLYTMYTVHTPTILHGESWQQTYRIDVSLKRFTNGKTFQISDNINQFVESDFREKKNEMKLRCVAK